MPDTNKDSFLPDWVNICLNKDGTESIFGCNNNIYRQTSELQDQQLLSAFHEPNFGPEQYLANDLANFEFNYFDKTTNFNRMSFQNRNECIYQEAKVNSPLRSCSINQDCKILGGDDSVCINDTCRSSACDNDYTVLINSTIQNDTYNNNYGDKTLWYFRQLQNPDWFIMPLYEDGNGNWVSLTYNVDAIYIQTTSALIYNNNVRNFMGDTLYDLQHRDWSSRAPSGFDHMRIERNLFSLGMTKNSSNGNPEDTTIYSNNIYINANVGGYNQKYRSFWINNSFIQPDKLTSNQVHPVDGLPDSYAKASYRLFHGLSLRGDYEIQNAPYGQNRLNIFNNSVIQELNYRGGYAFLDVESNAAPSGIRFTSGGNLILSENNNISAKAGGTITCSSSNLQPLPESYSNRTDFIKKYCYDLSDGDLVFDKIKSTTDCQNNNSLSSSCNLKWDDIRCFIGGHDNNLNGGHDFGENGSASWIILEASSILSVVKSSNNSPNFDSNVKCPNLSISSEHLDYQAPSFHSMSSKYRVHRDFYGRNRYVKTTPGAFEKGDLANNGCRN